MPRIHYTIVCIEEIVVDKHLIPCSDKVDINIICHLQVASHSEEASEGVVNGVLECKTVETILILDCKTYQLTNCEVCCQQESQGKLCWGTPTTHVKDIRHMVVMM